MNKSILLLLIISTLFLTGVSPVFAAASCQPLFGGGATCVQSNQITIDKQIKNPSTGNYVDSLSQNDSKYTPGEEISFKLVVKNTSVSRLINITVSDALPQFVEFVSGTGTFDKKTNTLTIPLASLASGQEDVIFLQGKVVSKNALPANANVICVANQAMVSVGSDHSQDNTQFCIEKNPASPTPIAVNQTQISKTTKGGLTVFNPTQTRRTPSTGPEAWEVIALFPTGALGYWLRRKTTHL